ncbi:hypothetical protein, partial [Crocosphaera sp.]|uniref:hypothetical protein n=1 Tax=Crocosphaera sp. TaxID=2729996 RepID=UPI00257C63F9
NSNNPHFLVFIDLSPFLRLLFVFSLFILCLFFVFLPLSSPNFFRFLAIAVIECVLIRMEPD